MIGLFWGVCCEREFMFDIVSYFVLRFIFYNYFDICTYSSVNMIGRNVLCVCECLSIYVCICLVINNM